MVTLSPTKSQTCFQEMVWQNRAAPGEEVFHTLKDTAGLLNTTFWNIQQVQVIIWKHCLFGKR